MPLRRLGISNYRLFWRRQVQASSDESVTRQFLPQFADDPSAMRDLRALLTEKELETPRFPPTDEQVLAGIARLLESGELLAVRDGPVHGGGISKDSNAGAPPPPPPSPSSGHSSSAAPEEATLPPNTNGAAQAAALSNAASNGAPFCSP